ncbi:MAG: hypothetical protein L0387_35675 [Acidobacteria bacterium]|nr:hypothetical protein [Acidobacteriota bacterium]
MRRSLMNGFMCGIAVAGLTLTALAAQEGRPQAETEKTTAEDKAWKKVNLGESVAAAVLERVP